MKTKIYKYSTLRKNPLSKTLLKSVALLSLLAMSPKVEAQVVCPGSVTTLTAINSQGLSNPSYSLNPGGITSSVPTFTVVYTANTVYTLYVTGTNSSSVLVTTSNTVAPVSGAPTFSLSSPCAFTLGCASTSACVVNINNANTVPPGGPISYTLLAPGSSTLLPIGMLSAFTTMSVATPGTWSVVVRDNASLCDSWAPVAIVQNTVQPVLGSISVPQQVLSCSTPSMTMQIAPSSGVNHVWYFVGTPGFLQGDNIQVFTNPLAPTATVINTYTLVATDVSNLCTTTTVIPVYQNIFPPNAAITGPPNSICQHTAIVTNVSTTGIPLGVFPTPMAVIGLLWEGPSQASLALSSTYQALSSGIYTMTAQDLNNGCIKTATCNIVLGPIAAFTHTINAGAAAFTDVSSNTGAGTNYFWDFGDGNTSTLQNPTHTYTNGGAHFVKFKVIKPAIFCSDSVIMAVTVSGVPCVANSNFSMVPTATAQVWNVIPSYPWNISAASWSWGDGSSSNTLYTSHQYSAAGMYNICLSVTVSCANTSSTCTSYSVYRTSQEAQVLSVNVVAPELISGLSLAGEKELASWNIAPNPNAGEFSLNFNTAKAEQVRVFISDLTGRIVYEQWILSDSKQTLQANLPSGMYLLTVEANKQRNTKRMVVVH